MSQSLWRDSPSRPITSQVEVSWDGVWMEILGLINSDSNEAHSQKGKILRAGAGSPGMLR